MALIRTVIARLMGVDELAVQDATARLLAFWGMQDNAQISDVAQAATDMETVSTAASVNKQMRGQYVAGNALLTRAAFNDITVDEQFVAFVGPNFSFGPPFVTTTDATCTTCSSPIAMSFDDMFINLTPRKQLLDSMIATQDIASWTQAINDGIQAFSTLISKDPVVQVRAAALTALRSAWLPVEYNVLIADLDILDEQLTRSSLDQDTRAALQDLSAKARGALHKAQAVALGQTAMAGGIKTRTVTTASGTQHTAIAPELVPLWQRWEAWLALVGGVGAGAALAKRRGSS